MKTLITEDDFTCRLLLQEMLNEHGPCHIAVNGREAVDAVRASLDQGEPYDLICMDIMMPEMDGQVALRLIRADEQDHDRNGEACAKIVMITALDEVKQVMQAYGNLCDGYLTKPIDKAALIDTLQQLKLM